MDTNNIFGKRVKELRTNANFTQQQLGDLVGLSKQTINDIEKGRSETKLSRALELAKVFSTNVEYLSGYEYREGALEPASYTPPQYSDAALSIAEIFDKLPPDAQRRIKRIIIGEYKDFCC